MFNWLGTWLGGWFGSGDPAPPGSMSGVASVSISTVATLTSTGSAPGMMSGTAALAISTTATITHTAPVATGNFWADGFWSAGFWADGFWGVFEQPYTELKPNLKLFVFTELEKRYALDVSKRVIAYAAKNEVSVRSAIKVINALVHEIGITVTPKRKTQSVDQRPRVQPGRRSGKTAANKKAIYASVVQPRVDVLIRAEALYTTHKPVTIPVTSKLESTTISMKRK